MTNFKVMQLLKMGQGPHLRLSRFGMKSRLLHIFQSVALFFNEKIVVPLHSEDKLICCIFFIVSAIIFHFFVSNWSFLFECNAEFYSSFGNQQHFFKLWFKSCNFADDWMTSIASIIFYGSILLKLNLEFFWGAGNEITFLGLLILTKIITESLNTEGSISDSFLFKNELFFHVGSGLND